MCGATSSQNQIEQGQQSLFNTMTSQAQQIFGSSSEVFGDLVKSFAPIVEAGPNQEGFSAPEKSALDSQAITDSGNAYRNASTSVKEAEAAVGGGNVALPGGANIGRDLSVSTSAAENTANELNQIEQNDYAQGRQNYFQAASGLAGAPQVFNPATSAGEAATGSGSAAANTANQIAQENNSWVSAVTGALGGVAGSVVSGGMKNLGAGVGFFGQNAGESGDNSG
jgi:hypothetical protein